MDALNKIMGDVMSDLKKISIKAPDGYCTMIEINGYEFEAIVSYTLIKAERGEYEGSLQLSPNTPAYVELDGVYIKEDGKYNLVDIPEQAMKDTLEEILVEYTG